jgi:hypothetical protein
MTKIYWEIKKNDADSQESPIIGNIHHYTKKNIKKNYKFYVLF